MKIINIKELNNSFEELINWVISSWQCVQVESEKGPVIIISQEEFNSLKEHLHVSKNSKLIQKVHNINNLQFESHSSISSLKQSTDG